MKASAGYIYLLKKYVFLFLNIFNITHPKFKEFKEKYTLLSKPIYINTNTTIILHIFVTL